MGFHQSEALRVFQDGRYIFHPLLMEAGEAARSPGAWQDFLDRHGIDAALMENLPLKVDGRPYHVSYMPRKKWTPICSDDRALLFRRRGT